jgi:hypothetical protein
MVVATRDATIPMAAPASPVAEPRQASSSSKALAIRPRDQPIALRRPISRTRCRVQAAPTDPPIARQNRPRTMARPRDAQLRTLKSPPSELS